MSNFGRMLKPDEIVVMDNLGSHKSEPSAADQKCAGLWCLPPYSPDLDPIEQVFAKTKALDAHRPMHRRRNLPPHRQSRPTFLSVIHPIVTATDEAFKMAQPA